MLMSAVSLRSKGRSEKRLVVTTPVRKKRPSGFSRVRMTRRICRIRSAAPPRRRGRAVDETGT